MTAEPTATDVLPGWTLTPDELDATRDKLAKINARAAKRGFTGRIELHAERVERTTVTDIGLTVTDIVYRTRLTGEAPSYGGWSLLAVLDWDQHAGLIVRTAPGVETVDRSGLRQGWCGHCSTSRHRTKTYLVGNQDGDTVQVGSTCLKDFLGWDGRPVFLSTRDVEDEIESGGFGGGDRSYTTLTVLAAAWAVITKRGYVRSSEAGATRDTVSMLLNPINEKERKAAREFQPYIAEADGKANEVREFVLSDEFVGDNEYVHNLKAICRADGVSPANLGLLVSAPQAWARAQERSLIRQRDAAEIRNEFHGEIGEKLDIRVRVKAVRWCENNYGVTTVYTLISEDGYVYKWYASRDALGDSPTEEFTQLRGTVKKYDEWNDLKSTVLTRCKVH